MKDFLISHKKIILGVILLVLLIFSGTRIISQKKERPSTSRVQKGVLTQSISASGKIKAKSQVDLKFQTSGQLIWVGVKEGDYVKKWQAIASLDKREVERTLKKKLLAFMGERWDFEQTQADYKVKKENYSLTDAEKRILEKAQFDLESTVADVEIANLAKQYATLITPIEGIVTQIDTPVAGVNITPATAVFTVIDPKSIIFSANIDEADIGKIFNGQKAKVTLDAYPEEEFESAVSTVAFSSVVTSGGGTAFPVEVILPSNENFKFKVGMNGDIKIIIEEKQNVLYVPNSAVFSREEKNFVWKIIEEKPKKQEIRIGLQNDENSEIIDGLSEDDQIVTEGISNIKQ